MRNTPDEYPKPIHNFKDDSKYERDGQHIFWQWEFLRRNPLFQYEADKPDHEREEHFLDPYPEWSSDWHYKDEHYANEMTSPYDDTAVQFPWNIAGPLEGPDFTRIIDPLTNIEVDKCHTAPDSSEFAWLLIAARETIPRIDDRLILLAFDAGQPAKPQVERLKNLLKSAKIKLTEFADSKLESSRKEEPSEELLKLLEQRAAEEKRLMITPPTRNVGLVTLIRILDGKAEGYSGADILKHLNIDGKHYYESELRAIGIRDRGYRLIP